MTKFRLLCAASALSFPATAMAQRPAADSKRSDRCHRLARPTRRRETPISQGARGSDDEFIQRRPGPTINDVINHSRRQLPDNDPTVGGRTLTIRGFDSTAFPRRSTASRSTIRAITRSIPVRDGSQLIEQSTHLGSPRRQPDGRGVRKHCHYRTRRPYEDFAIRLPIGRRTWFLPRFGGSTPALSPLGERAPSHREACRTTTMSSTTAARSTSSSITPAFSSRSARTAISSRSPAITIRLATTSSARSRFAWTALAQPRFRAAFR